MSLSEWAGGGFRRLCEGESQAAILVRGSSPHVAEAQAGRLAWPMMMRLEVGVKSSGSHVIRWTGCSDRTPQNGLCLFVRPVHFGGNWPAKDLGHHRQAARGTSSPNTVGDFPWSLVQEYPCRYKQSASGALVRDSVFTIIVGKAPATQTATKCMAYAFQRRRRRLPDPICP